MANRHLSRTVVLQTLFEWDFMDATPDEARAMLERNIAQFIPGVENDPFAVNLLKNIIYKQKTIDEILAKAAPEWPVEKISMIDRNILRIGIYELLFSDRGEVPPKVAINEAIEIGKSFGGDSSGRFVNGVMGAIYKELGEPNKDETSEQKHDKKKAQKPLPVEGLVGAVVYAVKDGQTHLAFVHDIFGHWTLAKGHRKDGEDDTSAAKRKIKEELGVEAEIGEAIGNNEYVASDPKKGKVKKQVNFYLAHTEYQPLTQGESKGLDDAQWFLLSDVTELNFYEDILPVITNAVKILNNK